MSSYGSSFGSSFGAWRFTVILGTVAILGSAGILSWAVATIPDMKTTPPERFGELAALPGNEQATDFAAALRAGPAEAGSSGWSTDVDWLSKQTFTSQAFVSDPKLAWPEPRADLPSPVSAPQANPQSQQAKPPLSRASAPLIAAPETVAAQALAPQAPAPQATASVAPAPQAATAAPPAEHQRRLVQAPKPEPPHAAAPAKPHRLAARPSYVEKIVEQGDAGAVTFRYRRHICAPPHMVDVCYMPVENRRGIVVERW
jgi:hypothetical protein